MKSDLEAHPGRPRTSREALEKLHHRGHDHCFVANSVTTEVVTEIRTASNDSR